MSARSAAARRVVAYDNLPELREYRTVLLVVCGGATATLEQIRGWAAAKS